MKAHSEIHFKDECAFLEPFEKFHIQNAQQAELTLSHFEKNLHFENESSF